MSGAAIIEVEWTEQEFLWPLAKLDGARSPRGQPARAARQRGRLCRAQRRGQNHDHLCPPRAAAARPWQRPALRRPGRKRRGAAPDGLPIGDLLYLRLQDRRPGAPFLRQSLRNSRGQDRSGGFPPAEATRPRRRRLAPGAGIFLGRWVQRLGLAQALLHEPELLILDEPTTGLDPEGRKLVADIILEEKARGTTIFLSSQASSPTWSEPATR